MVSADRQKSWGQEALNRKWAIEMLALELSKLANIVNCSLFLPILAILAVLGSVHSGLSTKLEFARIIIDLIDASQVRK